MSYRYIAIVRSGSMPALARQRILRDLILWMSPWLPPGLCLSLSTICYSLFTIDYLLPLFGYLTNIIFNAIRRSATPNILSRMMFGIPVAILAPRKLPKKKPRQIRPATFISTYPCL